MTGPTVTVERRSFRLMPIVLCVAMLATAVGVELLQPQPIATAEGVTLAQSVPSQFGDWKEVSSVADQVDPSKGTTDEPSMDRPYDDVLMRAYGNSRGEVVLLALAYGRNQRQEVKIHRPDVCYTAQGFQLISRSHVALGLTGTAGTPVEGMRMLVKAPGRMEAVSYWIRIGDVFTDNAWAIRYHIFQQGMSGRAVDGVLVRASQIVSGAEAASPERYRVQEQFLSDLVRALPAPARRLLVG
jgi:EpsI family protein